MPTQAEYIDSLRNFVKDHEVLNRLIKFKEENTDSEMTMYLDMALNFLNSVPPILQFFDYEAFPLPNLLIHQASIEVMISNSIVSARNDLTYNNGGLTVKITDGNRYLNVINTLLRFTNQEIDMWRNMKVAANLNNCFGGVYSPYSRLHGRQQTLNPNTLLSG